MQGGQHLGSQNIHDLEMFAQKVWEYLNWDITGNNIVLTYYSCKYILSLNALRK